MPKPTILSKDDVLHVAKLANLTISEENIEMYRKQLSETISYVENLDELDTSKVEPTSHSTNTTNVYFEDGTANTRQFSQDETLENGKSKKNGQFLVKRIMG